MYRLAIVDDEAIVRKGLCSLINWELLSCQVVCEATDGQALLDRLPDARPDIVITDIKMPRMDGLELCRRLREAACGVQIIMLTAYSDFEYARGAMRYGVTDYVTKSGGMQEVIQAVQHAIEQLEERRLLLSRQEVQGQSLEALRGNFLKNVFTGVLHEDELLRRRADSLEMVLDSFAVLCLETVAPVNPAQAPRIDPLLDFLTQVFQGAHCWCIPLEKDLFAVVLACSGQDFPYERTVQQCQKVLQVLQNLYAGNIFMGISSVFHGAAALAQACSQAREALGRRFLDDTSRIYLYQDKSRQLAGGREAIDCAAQAVLDAVAVGDIASVDPLLEALFDVQKHSNSPAEMLKSQALSINERCGRLLAERGLYRENIYEHDVNFFQQITACRSMDAYKALVTPLVLDTCRRVHDALPTADPVYQARRYIVTRCCEGPTLEDVAAAIHLSPSHLARLYKEATGSTVKADINALRLARAKQVLHTPGCTVQDAADAIGMNDLAYFSHFFKKHTNMTPKQYQMQLRQTPAE